MTISVQLIMSSLSYGSMTVKPVMLFDYSPTCDIVWLQTNLWYCPITVKPVILSEYSQTCDIVWLQSSLQSYDEMRRRRQEENLLLEREKLEDEQQLQSLLTAQHQKKVEQIADLSKVFIKSSQSQTIHATPYGHVCQWHIHGIPRDCCLFVVVVRSKVSGFQMLEHKIAT